MSGQAGEVHAMQPVKQDGPRERGRPARTMPGTVPAISATWIERQWHQGIFFINIDAQDKRDETFLHRKPAQAMIRRGLADAQDAKPAVS